jgi:hypothetical protein
VHGINGRKVFETWLQIEALPAKGKLDREPLITHRLMLYQFADAMKPSRRPRPSRLRRVALNSE